MSKNTGTKTVTLSDLLARADELRQYVSILQQQINTLSSQFTELQFSLTTIEELPEEGSQGLIVLDRLNTVFVPVKIPSDWKNKVLVNIGLNYYIRLDKNKAKEVIEKRISSLRMMIEQIRRQYEQALVEYNALQQVLVSIYAQIQQRAQNRQQETGSG